MVNSKALYLGVSLAIATMTPWVSVHGRSDSLSARQFLADTIAFQRPFTLSLGNPVMAQGTGKVRWKPSPDRGRAGGTLSGGRRGSTSIGCPAKPANTSSASVKLLVPANSTRLLTVSEQPTLSWYVQTQSPISGTVVVSDPGKAQPIFSQPFQVESSGVVSVPFPESVRLNLGTRYRWVVFVSCQQGSTQEIYARSFIERIDREVMANLKMGGQPVIEQAATYAAEGIWYDALQALLSAHQTNPSNVEIKAELNFLLRQADQQFVNLF